jgi:Glycosyltransferase family 87
LPKSFPFAALALALVAAASTWFYSGSIMRAQQIAYDASHNRPRGNLSDLYPRWLGARELLLHGRNPYSPEITREIQQGYYGRPLDPNLRDDPKDQQGFAYPAYVVFLLAPTVWSPFALVQFGFRWLLVGLGAVSVLLWLRVLRWQASFGTILIAIVLLLGSVPMMQGLRLQQLTLLVAAILAACGACLSGGWLFCSGALLALATIKPQLAWPVAFWLLVWAASDWKARRRLIFGFGITITLLFAGAELLLPGWLRMWFDAIREYHRYTQNQSVVVVLFGTWLGWVIEAASLIATAACLWRIRKQPAGTTDFGRAFALVLALTVMVVPMFAPYNQVLLVPAILALVRSHVSNHLALPAFRLAGRVGAFFLAWQWIATVALTLIYLCVSPAFSLRHWALPFYANFVFPVFAFGLAFLNGWMNPGNGLRDHAVAE